MGTKKPEPKSFDITYPFSKELLSVQKKVIDVSEVKLVPRLIGSTI